MAGDETIRDEAIAWAVRTGDAAFDNWEGFTDWLEHNPAHAAAYDEAVMAVADAASALPAIPCPGNDDEVVPAPRRRWLGGSVAAVLAVVAALSVWQLRGDTYAVETAPGEVRLVELVGGGQIAVAGDTRIVLDRDDPNVASLERGQALFTMRHESTEPFRLTVGGNTLVDIGTVFDVEHSAAGMSVAVSEGAVLFNPDSQNVRVAPGQMLSSDTASGSYRLVPIPAAQVGEWREGRLTFQDTALADVASALSRATGVPFEVLPRFAAQRVSGSVLIEPVRSDPRELGPLLGVAIRHNGEAWEIGAR